MRKRNEESRAQRHQNEVRNRIGLKVSGDGEILMIIDNAGNETAIRKFTDSETVKDIKAVIKQVTEVAVRIPLLYAVNIVSNEINNISKEF